MAAVETNGEPVVLNAEFPRVEGNVSSVIRLTPVESGKTQTGATVEVLVQVTDEAVDAIDPNAVPSDGCGVSLAGETISEPDTDEDSARTVLALYPDMNDPRQVEMVQQLFPALDIASLVPTKQEGEDMASAANPDSIVTGDVRIPLQAGPPPTPYTPAGDTIAPSADPGSSTSSTASLSLATPDGSVETPETAASSAEPGNGSRIQTAPVLKTSGPDRELSPSSVPMDTTGRDGDSSPVTSGRETVPKAAPPQGKATVSEIPLPNTPQPSSRNEIPAAPSTTATALPYGQETPLDTGRELIAEIGPDISGPDYSSVVENVSASETSSGTRLYRNTLHTNVAVSSESGAISGTPSPSVDDLIPQPRVPEAGGTEGNKTAPSDISANTLSAEPARSSAPSRQVVLSPITALTPDGERIEVRIRIQQAETGESGVPVTPETHTVAPTLTPDESGAVIVQSPDAESVSSSPSRAATAGSSTAIPESAETPESIVITGRLIRESRPSPEWSAQTEPPAANAEGEERVGEIPSPETMTFRKTEITISAPERPNPPETVSRTVAGDGKTSPAEAVSAGKTVLVTEQEMSVAPLTDPEPPFGNEAIRPAVSETTKDTTNTTRVNRTGSESVSPLASRLVTSPDTATSGRTHAFPGAGDSMRAAPQSADTSIPIAPDADRSVISRPVGNVVTEDSSPLRADANGSGSPSNAAANAVDGSGITGKTVETFMPGTARKIHLAAPAKTDLESTLSKPKPVEAESIPSIKIASSPANELNGASGTPQANEAGPSGRVYSGSDGTRASGDDTSALPLEKTETAESSPLRSESSEETAIIPDRTISRMRPGDTERRPELRRSAGEGETTSFPVRPDASSSIDEGTGTANIRTADENIAPDATGDSVEDVSGRSPMTAGSTTVESSPRKTGRDRRDGSRLSAGSVETTEGEETTRAEQVANELASIREARIEKRIHRAERRSAEIRKSNESTVEFSSSAEATVSSNSSTATPNVLRQWGNTVSEPFSGELRRSGLSGTGESEPVGGNDPAVMRAALEATATVSETKRSFGPKTTMRHSESPEFETGILNSVVRQARFMLQSGQSSAAITLDPPSLGKMRLEIVTENSRITGKIMVESREVQDIIRNNMADLRQSLSQGGLQVESFDVQVGHNGGTDSWARREDMESLAESSRHGLENTVEASETPASVGIRSGHGVSGPGYIDMWV